MLPPPPPPGLEQWSTSTLVLVVLGIISIVMKLIIGAGVFAHRAEACEEAPPGPREAMATWMRWKLARFRTPDLASLSI